MGILIEVIHKFVRKGPDYFACRKVLLTVIEEFKVTEWSP